MLKVKDTLKRAEALAVELSKLRREGDALLRRVESLETEESYDSQWIKAEYETMGWGKEPEQEWEFELDETGTKLIEKKISNP